MINFPSSPNDGDIFTVGANSWIWVAASNQWRTYAPASDPAGTAVALAIALG